MALKIKNQLTETVNLAPFEKLLSELQLLQELAHSDHYKLLCEQAVNNKC